MAHAVVDVRFAGALPLGLNSGGKGALSNPTARAGKGMGLVVTRRVAVCQAGPLDVEIMVSDTLDMDGKIVSQMVNMQAVPRASMAPITENDYDAFGAMSPDRVSPAMPHIAKRPESVAIARNQFAERFKLSGGERSGPSNMRKPSTLGWGAFAVPSFLQRAGSTGGSLSVLRGSSIMGRARSVLRSGLVLSSSVRARVASLSTKLSPFGPMNQLSLPGAPSLAGMVGVSAMLQHVWEGSQAKVTQGVGALQELGNSLEEAAEAAVQRALSALERVPVAKEGELGKVMPGPSLAKIIWDGIVINTCDFSMSRLGKIIKIADIYRKRYGSVVKLTILGRNILLITDPAAYKEVHGAAGSESVDRSFVYPLITEVATGKKADSVLLGSEADEAWRNGRRAITRALQVAPMRKDLFPLARGKIGRLMELLRDEQTAAIEPSPFFQSYVAEVTPLATKLMDNPGYLDEFAALRKAAGPGNNLSALPHEPHAILNSVAEILNKRGIADPLCMMPFIGPHIARGLSKAWELFKGKETVIPTFQGLVTRVTEDVVSRAAPAKDDQTFAATMTRLYQDGSFSKDRVASEIFGMLLAGVSSTGETIAAVNMLLAKHPEWQDRIVAELTEAGIMKDGVPNPDFNLTLDSVTDKLPVLEACIKEGLRMRPAVAIGTMRQASKDITIAGVQLKKGDIAFNPFTNMFMSDQNFIRAGEFLPDRWLGADAQQEEGAEGADGSAAPAPAKAKAAASTKHEVAGTPAAIPTNGVCPESGAAAGDSVSGRCPWLEAQGYYANGASGGASAQATGGRTGLGSALAKLGGRVGQMLGSLAGWERRVVNADGSVPGAGFSQGVQLAPTMTGASKAFMPFGEGVRSCPGRALALMQIRLAMVETVRNFKIQNVSGLEGEVVTWDPEKVRLRYVPRTKA